MAKDSCAKAVRLEPTNADAHINLGESFRMLGEHDAAIESYNTALSLNPQNTKARLGR